MPTLEAWVIAAADWIWGLPLLLLISGGGLYFLIRSRFVPFRHLGHALRVLAGKYNDPDAPGQVSHFRALSVALAATIGMGNISSVAVAITIGGPGIVFWMWVSALLGIATKYFTCSLAVMYRRRDESGELQGGPMYFITVGLGRRWRPLAILFCVAGMFGCLPIFNANQLTQAIRDVVLVPNGIENHWSSSLAIGLSLIALVTVVIAGGLQRISTIVAGLVPFMVVIYFLGVVSVLTVFVEELPRCLGMIFTDAFEARYYKGDAMFGGAVGGMIVFGARRAAFSNEAGLGTAAMAHGAAKTSEPVHEGLVAMLGPVIDTLFICTLTSLALLASGVWETTSDSGVTLTANAFEAALPGWGPILLLVCVICFSLSSLFSYAYYGSKCFTFLFGVKRRPIYMIIYTASILVGALSSMALIINFIDFMFALMAIPTILAAVLLAPRVVQAQREYQARRATTEGSP